MTIIEERVIHQWEPMSEYLMDSDQIITWIEGSIEEKVKILGHLKPNQYMSLNGSNDSYCVRKFNGIIDGLRHTGLDVGRGEASYGYKMPLPKNGEIKRKLVIFRRK
jgi:hypothetical protein